MHALLDAPLQHLLQLLGCVGAALQCETAVVITLAKSRCAPANASYTLQAWRAQTLGWTQDIAKFCAGRRLHVHAGRQLGFLESTGRLTMGLFGWHSSTALVGCPSASAAAAAFASAGTQLPSSPGCAQCTGHGLSPAEACSAEAAVVVRSVVPIGKHDYHPQA